MLYANGQRVEALSHSFGSETVTVQSDSGAQETVNVSELTADGGESEIQSALAAVRVGQ